MKKYIFKHKGLFIVTVLFTVLVALVEVFLALVLKDIIDITTTGKFLELRRKMIFGLLFILLAFSIDYIRKLFEFLYTRKTLIFFKNDIFKKIIARNIKSFNQVNSAEYMSTLTNDINIIKEDHIMNLFQIIFNLVSFVGASILVIKINVYIAIITFAVGFLPLSIPIIFGKKVSKSKKIYSDNLSFFTVKIKDIFSGFEVIKSFNIEDMMNKEYMKSNTSLEKSRYKFNIISGLVDLMSQNCGFLVYFIILGVGAYFVMKKTLTFGALLAVIQLMGNIVNPLINISSRLNKIKSVKLIENKIMKIINKESNDDSGIDKDDFNEDICFENVSFSYDENKKVLNDVNLNIKKGYKYALVGNSGCGKSTLLKLLLRYYDNYEGNIKIDGIDNRQINFKSIHNLISMIHQNVFMFEGSIKQNITLFKESDEKKINEIIKLSGMEQFIKGLSNGIESYIYENGKNISGGEKQRIAIARTLINDTPIIALDEATSALDNETATNIENSILGLKNTTCLVVTHKLLENILKKYDKILVLKNGQICEQGSFGELMNLKGYFYSLYNVSQ